MASRRGFLKALGLASLAPFFNPLEVLGNLFTPTPLPVIDITLHKFEMVNTLDLIEEWTIAPPVHLESCYHPDVLAEIERYFNEHFDPEQEAWSELVDQLRFREDALTMRTKKCPSKNLITASCS